MERRIEALEHIVMAIIGAFAAIVAVVLRFCHMGSQDAWCVLLKIVRK